MALRESADCRGTLCASHTAALLLPVSCGIAQGPAVSRSHILARGGISYLDDKIWPWEGCSSGLRVNEYSTTAVRLCVCTCASASLGVVAHVRVCHRCSSDTYSMCKKTVVSSIRAAILSRKSTARPTLACTENRNRSWALRAWLRSCGHGPACGVLCHIYSKQYIAQQYPKVVFTWSMCICTRMMCQHEINVAAVALRCLSAGIIGSQQVRESLTYMLYCCICSVRHTKLPLYNSSTGSRHNNAATLAMLHSATHRLCRSMI